MKLYIIDSSKPFDGSTLHITDEKGLIPEDEYRALEKIEDGECLPEKGITLEELKRKRNNPFLIGISEQELWQKHKELRDSLIKEFEEIEAHTYEAYLNNVPSFYYERYILFDYFLCSECYQYDLYQFSFKHNNRYFSGLRSRYTKQEQLREEIQEFLKRKGFLLQDTESLIHEKGMGILDQLDTQKKYTQ